MLAQSRALGLAGDLDLSKYSSLKANILQQQLEALTERGLLFYLLNRTTPFQYSILLKNDYWLATEKPSPPFYIEPFRKAPELFLLNSQAVKVKEIIFTFLLRY